jgi:hypothetical protein
MVDVVADSTKKKSTVIAKILINPTNDYNVEVFSGRTEEKTC